MILLGTECYDANLTTRGVIEKLSNHCLISQDNNIFENPISQNKGKCYNLYDIEPQINLVFDKVYEVL